MIEKHFTLARADGGVDSAFSLEPAEFRLLRTETERAALGVGEVHYGPTEAEKPSLAFRRSLYIARDAKAGDVLTTDNVRIVRPGFGMAPRMLDVVLGMTLRKDASAGTPLSWELLN